MASEKRAKKSEDMIVVDEEKDLKFSTEEELFGYFEKDVVKLEEEYFQLRSSNDLDDKDFARYEKNLVRLLEDPDEVWEDESSLPDKKVFIYLREFDSPNEDEALFHVAVAYMAGDMPSFIYLHFPTRDIRLAEHYQRGEIVYDRILENASPGALDGDALLEGEPLASGLYEAMLKVRSDHDIREEEFREFAHLREEAIEEADEIWRNNDSMGNVLVTFIKEFHEEGPGAIYYVVVTLEDTPSNSHALLFSFPTTDEGLLDRYRHGENLQADEVVQEASH
ncbi:MAG: peptidase [Pseudobdellovibrionaceae bacterium]|nr:peptidase [Bdellovibrionales bacterium]USN47605.1 MAG: peptidase [Pseudobdellovibrionaceae bacterium]